MAIDEFSIPSHVRRKLRDMGYAAGGSMDGHIAMWWGWYTADNGFYKVGYTTTDDRRRERARMSLRPARKAAREWASLLLNDGTSISVDDAASNEWLAGFLEAERFWPNGQSLVEKAFALGTGAWALWFDVVSDSETRVRVRRYDARMVVPLSWDDDGVTECAFCTRVSLRGKMADQLQVHAVGEAGTYEISTFVFVDGREESAERHGILDVFDTGCATPTFAVVRPGIENVVADNSPYGMSVFADAIDAIKAVDLAFDAIFQEVDLTEVKVFMDEQMIDVRSADGRAVPVPKGPNSRIFRKLMGKSASDLYEVFSPAIRTEPLERALNIALAEFGDQTGFGTEYFTLDKAGGLKTATEVVSDNSVLMRNARKHENAIGAAVQTVVRSLLTCARIHCGAPVAEDFGEVRVEFDDSVMVDTLTEKNTMMAEIAAGLVPKWKYAARFYGLGEDEAKAYAADGEIVDVGF